MNYKYTEKEVEIGFDKYKAIFPEGHSRVEGLIFTGFDRNRHDTRGGVYPDWQRVMFILWIGKSEWECISPCDEEYEWAHIGDGFFKVLTRLESDEATASMYAIQRVKDLKNIIPVAEKDLLDMKKEFFTLTGHDLE